MSPADLLQPSADPAAVTKGMRLILPSQRAANNRRASIKPRGLMLCWAARVILNTHRDLCVNLGGNFSSRWAKLCPSESLGGRGALSAAPAVALGAGNGAGGDAEGDKDLGQLH